MDDQRVDKFSPSGRSQKNCDFVDASVEEFKTLILRHSEHVEMKSEHGGQVI